MRLQSAQRGCGLVSAQRDTYVRQLCYRTRARLATLMNMKHVRGKTPTCNCGSLVLTVQYMKKAPRTITRNKTGLAARTTCNKSFRSFIHAPVPGVCSRFMAAENRKRVNKISVGGSSGRKSARFFLVRDQTTSTTKITDDRFYSLFPALNT